MHCHQACGVNVEVFNVVIAFASYLATCLFCHGAQIMQLQEAYHIAIIDRQQEYVACLVVLEV